MRLIRKMFLYVLKGMVAIIPIFLLGYALVGIYKFFQGMLPEVSLVYVIIAILIIFFLLGLFLTHQVPRGVKFFIKRKLQKKTNFNFPLRVFYRITRLFVREGKIFDQPVWIIDGSDKREIGFITSNTLKDFDAPDHVSVFIPRPFSLNGGLAIVSREKCVPITKNKDQVLTMVLSGGLSKDVYAELEINKMKEK